MPDCLDQKTNILCDYCPMRKFALMTKKVTFPNLTSPNRQPHFQSTSFQSLSHTPTSNSIKPNRWTMPLPQLPPKNTVQFCPCVFYFDIFCHPEKFSQGFFVPPTSNLLTPSSALIHPHLLEQQNIHN